MNNDSIIEKNSEQGRGARRRARTRADLLAAARRVFAARGYHDASIAEITELADVGVGTFYLHFRDKDEAFTTLLQEGLREIREQVLAAVGERPQEQALAVVIRTILRHAYERRDLFQISLSGGGQVARTFRAQAWLAEGLTQVLEAANARGLLKGYTLPLLARFITGMITQGIVWWFEHDEPGPDLMTEQVLHLLSHGLPAQLFFDD
jgi:AcrR family transcriptional regulator